MARKATVLSSEALTLWPVETNQQHIAPATSAEVADKPTPSTPSPVSAPLSPPTTQRAALYARYRERITPNPALDRTLISFQANKRAPFYGWFKYREGFSEPLVSYILDALTSQPGVLLDPFAGAGSALFAAAAHGWIAHGIELLPVGVYAIQARLMAARVAPDDLATAITHVASMTGEQLAARYDEQYALRHIPITRGAFPQPEERALVGYLVYCHTEVADEAIRALLIFAAFCVLEDISYTRKDGQYLRWDVRSGRSVGKRPFHKGEIPPFSMALKAKLQQMLADVWHAGHAHETALQLPLFAGESAGPDAVSSHMPVVEQGSCLELLPARASGSVDFVLTSPPYANRYDYTRTYALELVFLGADASEVKQLRQAMLSCTVENREKRTLLEDFYSQRGQCDIFRQVDGVFAHQEALHEVLAILEGYRRAGKLNNDNIARLVHNYFYEMCFTVYELARVLKPGGVVVMVNDNVRYAGEEIPVDLILASFAESFGLHVRHIWTLGRGKGNSSQQMGAHGRAELRKCVYVWEKPAQ